MSSSMVLLVVRAQVLPTDATLPMLMYRIVMCLSGLRCSCLSTYLSVMVSCGRLARELHSCRRVRLVLTCILVLMLCMAMTMRCLGLMLHGSACVM